MKLQVGIVGRPVCRPRLCGRGCGHLMRTVASGIGSYLEGKRDALINELLEFMRIPAIAIEGGPEIERMARRAAVKCEEAGLHTRIEGTRGHPVVYASAGPENAPFTLLYYGHYDVFPVSDQPGWDTDPFVPVIRGDRIYGRGSGDNKGQFLAHLNALQWWQHEAGGLPLRVQVILEGEEENGSQNLPEFIARNHAELSAADLCVYSDGPMQPGDQPALLFGARGALVMEFHSTGPARPLHSGNFGGVLANPIIELSRLFAAMLAPNSDLLPPGANKGVPEVTAAERAALDTLGFDAAEFRERTGSDPLPERFGEQYYERLLYKPSFNVSGIVGGYTGKGMKTLIPTSAMAKADLRLVGDQDPDEVLAAFRRFAEEQGFAGVEIRKLFSQPPSRTPIDHPYADLVEQAVTEAFGKPAVRVPSLAGTTPDYVFTKMLGIPAFMLPFAPTDENHHGPNESMKVSLFMNGIRASARLVEVIADACTAGTLPPLG